MYPFITLMLFMTGAITVLPGLFSKAALIILLMVNVVFFKWTKLRLKIFVFFIAFLLLKCVSFILWGGGDFDERFIVFTVYILFFISIPFQSSRYRQSIINAVFYLVVFGGVASLVSYILGGQVFLLSLDSKGLPGYKAMIGFTTTPQTYASLCLMMVYACLRSVKSVNFKALFFIGLIVFTMNRTGFIAGVLLAGSKIVNKVIVSFFSILFLLLLMYMIVGGFSSGQGLLSFQTIASRLDMLKSLLVSFVDFELHEMLFGVLDKPLDVFSTELYSGDYIENGFAFLGYYLGAIGVFGYLSFFVFFVFVISLSDHVELKLRFLDLTFLTVVFILLPMLTHEFLYLSFYLSLALLIHNYSFEGNNSESVIYN